MIFYKDEQSSTALKTAINAFGKRNKINAMDYFAEKLGFKGVNRAVQLHNHITHKNVDKSLKITQHDAILEEMNQKERKIALDGRNGKFGFFAQEMEKPKRQEGKTIEAVVTVFTLEIGSKVGEMYEYVLQAIKDGELDESEARRILRGIPDIEAQTRGLRDALIEHIGE